MPYLNALTFLHSSRQGKISRERLEQAAARLLSEPAAADFAVGTLRSMRAWQYTQQVAELYESLKSYPITMPSQIRKYMIACRDNQDPKFQSEAKQAADWIRKHGLGREIPGQD